jgi:diacylglycerol O-acyltransferase / wax synthase
MRLPRKRLPAGNCRSLFRRRVKRVPLDLEHPWRVDDGPADLGYHMSRLALPTPADWREFCGQVARYLERALDMSRPPWEMPLIEGLDKIEGMPKGAFALVRRCTIPPWMACRGWNSLVACTIRSRRRRPGGPICPAVSRSRRERSGYC